MQDDFDYEAVREANIAKNTALIAALKLGDTPFVSTKKPPAKKPKAPKAAKRKAEHTDEDGHTAIEEPAKKAAAMQDSETGGLRRSGRNAGKKVDYAGDGDKLQGRGGPRVVTEAARRAEANEAKSTLQRKHDPYVFP